MRSSLRLMNRRTGNEQIWINSEFPCLFPLAEWAHLFQWNNQIWCTLQGPTHWRLKQGPPPRPSAFYSIPVPTPAQCKGWGFEVSNLRKCYIVIYGFTENWAGFLIAFPGSTGEVDLSDYFADQISRVFWIQSKQELNDPGMQIEGRSQIAWTPDLHVLWWPICPIQFGFVGTGDVQCFEGKEGIYDDLKADLMCYWLIAVHIIIYCWVVSVRGFENFTVDLYRVNSQECSHGCHMRGCLEGQGFVQKALHHTHAYYWWFIVQELHLCTGRHPHCLLCYVLHSI